MKKIYLILALILLTACSKPTAKETPILQVMNEITSEIEIPEISEEDLTDQKNAEKYGISTDSIIDGIACYSNADNNADKIIIVRAKEQKEIEGIEKALSAELTAAASAWEGNETESKKIEKAILKTKDDCIIMAISDKIEEIERIFDKNI